MFVTIKNCTPNLYGKDILRIEAIEQLLEAHGKRNHIIYSKKSICNDVINSSFYGSRYKKYASDLINYKTEIGTFKTSFEFTVEFDFNNNDEFIINKLIVGNRSIIQCSYKLLLHSTFKNKANFLAEDESDCDFYSLMAQMYSSKFPGRLLNSSLNFIEGGGSRTHPKYQKMMCDKSFGICIIDNDKAHPKGKEGSTSSAFKVGLNQRGWFENKECIILDFHEAESIIPDSVLSEVIDTSKINSFDAMLALDQSSKYKFRQYFDHKNGITIKQGFALDKEFNSPFWYEIFFHIPEFKLKPCFNTKKCPNRPEHTKCTSCITIEGFGTKTLEKSIKHLKSNHLRKTCSNLTPHIESQWEFIGAKVLAWGCNLQLPAIKAF